MPRIEAATELSPSEAELIEDLLIVHGQEKGFVWDEVPLSVLLRDGERIVGGLTGKTVQGWLYIGGLALASEWRGQGYGRKLVKEAERIAVGRGCHSAWLNTHSFQAPGFYERLGYEPFGILDDFPKGERRYFFAKRLRAPEAAA
jgi:ribosomal protein S18 acetylase RimI-like enzyme